MDGIATGGDKLDPGMGTFVELGCGVGDGDERHHDVIQIILGIYSDLRPVSVFTKIQGLAFI